MDNDKTLLIGSNNISYIKINSKEFFFKSNHCFINNYIKLIFIFILIFIIILFNEISIKKIKYLNEINNDFKDENYSLHYLFSYPQISIIISNIEKSNIQINEIFNLIDNLKNQTFKNIEINFFLSNRKYNHIYNNNIRKYTTDKRIRIFNDKNNLLDNIFYSVEKTKGKFIAVINKIQKFNLDEFYKYYNLTKGKINNIFKFNTNYGNILYLIKAHVLRDIFDKDLKFTNFTSLVNFIISMPNPKLDYISISLCPDNNYSGYAHVSMISILSSKSYSTYISFFIIIDDNFTQGNIDFLSSVYEEYDNFNMTFIKIDNRYEIAYISRYLTKQTYYRFSLGELIPNLNKIIYLDTDTIVYNDLTEFYNINFNGKIILGQPTYFNHSPKTGIYKINNGVLMLNLKKMREIEMEKKVLYILSNGFKNDYHDQYLLNQYFNEYIGIFPPKFHIRPWNNFKEIKQFNKDSGKVYNNYYFYFACKHPTILHFVYNSKPLYSNISGSEDWWYFARKSKYFKFKTDNLTNVFEFKYK